MARHERQLTWTMSMVVTIVAGIAAQVAQPAHGAESSVDQARAAVRINDIPRAVALLEPLAKAGDAQAQYLLAGILRSGRAGAVDNAAVRRLYADAAAQNHAAAAYSLAALLATEEPLDLAAAQEWLRRSAANGYAPATATLQLGRLPLQFKPGRDAADPAARLAVWWVALASDDVETVEALTDAATLRAVDDFGRTAVSRAALNGAKRSLAFLIGHGANVDQADRFGATPLMLAAAAGNVDAVNQLLQASAAIGARDSVGNTALMHAARERRTAIVNRLLDAGADVSDRNLQGMNALDLALRTDAPEVVASLRAHGLSASLAVATSTTPVLPLQHAPAKFEDLYKGWSDSLIAASRSSPALINSMIADGTVAQAELQKQPTPLAMAVMAGSPDTLASLLRAYPGETPDARSAIQFAVRRGNLAAVQTLLAHGASANVRQSTDTPLIAAAVREHHRAVVELLLAHDADIDAADARGMTATMIAAASGQADLVRLLLSRGAKHAIADQRGSTALWYAAASGCTECAVLLVDAGAQVDLADGAGCTALGIAAQRGSLEMVERLLKQGANPRAITHNGSTPLMFAAARGEPAVIQRLLASGSQLNAQDRFGDTALIVATRAGNVKAATLLVQAGADAGLRNRDRAAAWDVAAALGFTELQSLLRGLR